MAPQKNKNGRRTAGGSARTKTVKRFTLDCRAPVDDEVMDTASFSKFLSDRIKVNGKAGQLGDKVSISRDDALSRVTVTAELPFSKRYLKYLSKKFLKKQQLRDYLHVVATGPEAYELRYYRVTPDDSA